MDYIKYAVASAAEKRSILVVEKSSGDEMEFKTRTEFYGRNKLGGWLQARNMRKGTDLTADDFIIQDIQRPEKPEHAFYSAKHMIQEVLRKLGTQKYYGYIGKGDSFRVGMSTIMEYKGQRRDTIKPVLLPEVEEYLLKHHNCEIITGIEADDACTIDSYAAFQKYGKTRNTDDHLILAAIDKDAYTTTCYLFNPNKMESPLCINGFGKLELDAKGKPRGYGRLWFYFFLLNGDTADNYSAHILTGTRFGEMSAYNLLKDARSDKEALEIVLQQYLKWYPEAFEFTSWRGDVIQANWMYVLQEIWDMAHMQRWEGDRILVPEVLDKLGIQYSV